MSTDTDFYELLEVERTADERVLKSAYRRLAMQYHPDRNPGSAEAEAKFKAISEAYDCLKDPQKRAAYDRFGKAAFQNGGGAGGGGGGGFEGFSDIFEDIGEAFEALSGATARASILKGGLAVTMIGRALLRTLQDVIGFADRLELRLGIGAAGVAIGMALHRDSPVR